MRQAAHVFRTLGEFYILIDAKSARLESCIEKEDIRALKRLHDAMTSKRSCRDVLSQEIVLAEIAKGKGSQFDPGIAELMIELIKEDKESQMHE